jgi:hypothetical protein
MLITRSRQLPDGEELVWDEETTGSPDRFDPREKALARRGQALSQWGVRRTALPADRPLVVGRIKVKADWQ